MSTKRATSRFKPSLEALGNRITPSHLKNLPILIPTGADAGGTVTQIGNLDVILRKAGGAPSSVIDSPTGGAGTGKGTFGAQTALFTEGNNGPARDIILVNNALSGSHHKVVTGSDGSLTAVGTAASRGNDCGNPTTSSNVLGGSHHNVVAGTDGSLTAVSTLAVRGNDCG
jgi:hypothetical protein